MSLVFGLSLLVLPLNLLDVWMTHRVVIAEGNLANEANLLARWVMAHGWWGYLAWGKILVAAAVPALTWVTPPSHQKTGMLLWIVGLYSLAVGWNTFVMVIRSLR